MAWLNGLPIFLTDGAPLARFPPRSSAINLICYSFSGKSAKIEKGCPNKPDFFEFNIDVGKPKSVASVIYLDVVDN